MPAHGSLDGVALGRNGGTIIADTSPHTGLDCGVVKALGNGAVIASMTLKDNWTGSMNGRTLAKGEVVPIQFTAITLTSGEVIAYND